MTHKRSLGKLEARKIRGWLLSRSFRDAERGETVSLTSTEEILLALGDVAVREIPVVERGEVLIDSRGKGSLQQLPGKKPEFLRSSDR